MARHRQPLQLEGALRCPPAFRLEPALYWGPTAFLPSVLGTHGLQLGELDDWSESEKVLGPETQDPKPLRSV